MAQQSAQPVASTEHIPAREHGRGFPPFDSHSFPSQLLWLALTFIALYLLMARVALPRIGSIVEGRRQHIADDLAQAQALKTESDAALAAHEKALNEARNRAQTLANETRAKASAEAEARRREVDAKLATHVSEAEKRIAATRSAAMSGVRGIAAEAASAIVERLIGVKPGQQEIGNAINAAVEQ
ncbi:MAG: F0F1 ATP synthase subunit B [Alphaproteobacteria bacterium]|nr:MAG: F0F1 ATP synthase subunit B [Alphaproteobacteria bacterium]